MFRHLGHLAKSLSKGGALSRLPLLFFGRIRVLPLALLLRRRLRPLLALLLRRRLRRNLLLYLLRPLPHLLDVAVADGRLDAPPIFLETLGLQ